MFSSIFRLGRNNLPLPSQQLKTHLNLVSVSHTLWGSRELSYCNCLGTYADSTLRQNGKGAVEGLESALDVIH